MEMVFEQLVFPILMAFNVLAFLLFGIDKSRAKGNGRRIPERTLLMIALVGPFGAYLGMRFFRHKTRKLRFVLVPVLIMLHLAMLVYLTDFI